MEFQLAINKDTLVIKNIVFSTLQEYGLAPDPISTYTVCFNRTANVKLNLYERKSTYMNDSLTTKTYEDLATAYSKD